MMKNVYSNRVCPILVSPHLQPSQSLRLLQQDYITDICKAKTGKTHTFLEKYKKATASRVREQSWLKK